MLDQTSLLSIVVPVRNEEHTIENVIDSLFEILSVFNIEVIVVENNSTDETITILNKIKLDRQIILISDSSILGKGEAVLRGIKKAKGTYVLIQDADMEYDIRDIIQLYQKCLLLQSDIILGNRFYSTNLQSSKAKINYLGNRLITNIFNCIHYTSLGDVETCYKIIKRSSLPIDLFESKKFEIELEFVAFFKSNDYKIDEIPISYSPRSKQEGKKIGYIDGLSAIFHIFYFKLKFTKNKNVVTFPLNKKSILFLLQSLIFINIGLLFFNTYKTIDLPWPIRRLEIDGGSYIKGVEQIINSPHWYLINDLYHSPGFQLYLYPFFKLFLSPIIFYKISNMVLVVFTLLLTFKIANRMISSTFALLAVLIVASSAQVQGYTSTLQPEILLMFLFTLITYFILKNTMKFMEQFAIGITAFLLVLIQVRFFSIILIVLFSNFRKRISKKISLIVFILLSISWCGVQSYYKQKFIFFSEGSHFRFLMAYNPNATGASFPYPSIAQPSGWNFIINQPIDTFGLFIKRYCYLWNLEKDIWDLGNPILYKLTGEMIGTSLDIFLHTLYFISFHICLALLFFTKKFKQRSVYLLACLILINFIGPLLIFSSSRFFIPTLPLVCILIFVALQEIIFENYPG